MGNLLIKTEFVIHALESVGYKAYNIGDGIFINVLDRNFKLCSPALDSIVDDIRADTPNLIVIELTDKDLHLNIKGQPLRFLDIKEAMRFTKEVLKPKGINSKIVVLPSEDRFQYTMITPKIWNKLNK